MAICPIFLRLLNDIYLCEFDIDSSGKISNIGYGYVLTLDEGVLS